MCLANLADNFYGIIKNKVLKSLIMLTNADTGSNRLKYKERI